MPNGFEEGHLLAHPELYNKEVMEKYWRVINRRGCQRSVKAGQLANLFQIPQSERRTVRGIVSISEQLFTRISCKISLDEKHIVVGSEVVSDADPGGESYKVLKVTAGHRMVLEGRRGLFFPMYFLLRDQ